MSDQTQEQTADASTAPQQTSLQLSDILLCAQVIQLASSRGAFRAEELSMVGAMYDKLTTFLQAVIEQAKAQEAANSAADQTQGE